MTPRKYLDPASEEVLSALRHDGPVKPTKPGPQPCNQIGTYRECQALVRAGLTYHPVAHQLSAVELATLLATIRHYRCPILKALGITTEDQT